MSKWKYACWMLILVPMALLAQNEDQLLPSEMKQLTAVTEPSTLRQGFFKLGTSWQYTGFKTIFNADAKKEFTPGSSIGRAEGLDLSLHYGVTDRIQVNINLPYMMDRVQSTMIWDDPLFNEQMQIDFEEMGFGLGDLATGINAQIIKESDYLPSITIRTTATLPTGRKNPENYSADSLRFDSPTGSGEFSLDIDIHARKIIYPYSFTFYSGIDYGFGGEKIVKAGENPSKFRSGTIYYANGGVNFHLNDWICMTNELNFVYIGKEEINGILQDETKWRVSLLPYIHFQVKKLRLVQGVIIPIKGKLIAANPSYLMLVQYIF